MGGDKTNPAEQANSQAPVEAKSMPQVRGRMEIDGFMHVFGEDHCEVVVIANTSAALVEGAQLVWEDSNIRRFDAYDAGFQMIAFAPNGSTLLVQMPEDKLTEEVTQSARRMLGLSVDSFRALGLEKEVNCQFVGNVHDALVDIANEKRVRVAPLFPSIRVLGSEHPAAQAAALFNNKTVFAQVLQSEGIRTPVTTFFRPDLYPETGFPAAEELINLCQEAGSDALFFKQDVSAAGMGVERVAISDPTAVTEVYEKWVKRMLENRNNKSTEWDFHIQFGETGLKAQNGEVESPCIVATIADDGTFDILQVAMQRLKDGTHHIGNVIDPEYEAAFLEANGTVLQKVLEVLAAHGVRGHVGIDVVVLEDGSISFIEINPRLNGNSALRVIRECVPADTVVVSNNGIKPTAAGMENIDQLKDFFYDQSNPSKPAVVITRAPRFTGDGVGLVFLNDHNQELERKVEDLLSKAA